MYCTLQDIKDQLPESVIIELTDDESNGTVNQGRVDAAIKAATDIINTYCRGLYPVPFNPVPGEILSVAVDIAKFNLFSRRGFNEDTADSVVVKRYNAAIKWLENVAKGTVKLDYSLPAPANEGGVSITSTTRVFSRDKLGGF